MSYKLSSVAQQHLKDIVAFSSDQFGAFQTARYIGGLEFLFELIGERPRIGRLWSQIGGEIRRHPYHSHIVYYKIAGDESVEILAIIHASRLPPEDFA